MAQRSNNRAQKSLLGALHPLNPLNPLNPQAFEKYTRVGAGYSGLKDVRVVPPVRAMRRTEQPNRAAKSNS